MFEANPHAIKEQIDKLLVDKMPGGGHRSVEDAMLIVNERKWAEPAGRNGWIFWDAVHSALVAMWKSGRR